MMIKSGHHGLQLSATPIMHIAYILLSTEDSTDSVENLYIVHWHTLDLFFSRGRAESRLCAINRMCEDNFR